MEDFRENGLNNCKIFKNCKRNYKDDFVYLCSMFIKGGEMDEKILRYASTDRKIVISDLMYIERNENDSE